MANDQQYDTGELDELNDALASQGTDELRVVSASDLGTVLNEIGGQAQSAVDVAAKIQAIADALASNGGDHLLVQESSALDVSGATVPTDLTSQQGRNLGKVRLMDSGGVLLDSPPEAASDSATTTSTGSGSAAAVTVPDGRTQVTAAWDVSGSATITIEVSPDGGATWYEEHKASPGSAETNTYSFSTGFDDVRVYVDQNLNSASIGAKGA